MRDAPVPCTGAKRPNSPSDRVFAVARNGHRPGRSVWRTHRQLHDRRPLAIAVAEEIPTHLAQTHASAPCREAMAVLVTAINLAPSGFSAF